MANPVITIQDSGKVEARQRGGKPASHYIGVVLRYLLLAVIGVVMFTPFILAFLGTVKADAEITAYPPALFPAVWHWENWVTVWNVDMGQGATFPRWLFNTAFLSITVAVLEAIFCSMAAFAFARMKFPGKNIVFNFMLASMMIPGAVTLIPSYVLMSKLKLINSFFSLIIPGAVSAGGIFILTQFFKSIPEELEDAAYIDGASPMQIYKDVILPLSRPALLTVLILQFQGMWNNFLTPLLYLNSPEKMVLNVALSIFQQSYKAQWNLTLVGAMFNAIPVMLIFFVFSKYYIEGVSYSGLKG